MTDTHHDHHDQVPARTEQPTPPSGQMDSRMMWVTVTRRISSGPRCDPAPGAHA